VQTRRIPADHRERIIRGRDNWWFLGPGGIARLNAGHLTADGALTPRAAGHLREQGLFSIARPSSYSLTVLTSTDCNLGCGYCFQNTGQDRKGGGRPPRIAHARLTSATITDILEFTKRQMSATGHKKLHVLLFGGEPLLNPHGCKELLGRVADYGMTSASMISNATLLTPALAKALVDLGLGSVQVTFDGDRPQHDLIRVRRSSGGTFDSIVQNMAAVSETVPLQWQVRVNVSHHNSDGIDALIDALAERINTLHCGIHFAWVGDVGIGYANEMRHSTALAERFFEWQRRALEAGFMVGPPSADSPCNTCSFVNGKYGATVNADGSLASCWETAGKPGWQVGTVTTGYRPFEQIQDRWISCEDSYQYSDDEKAVTTFRDAVDAAFLDYLYETDRLQSLTGAAKPEKLVSETLAK
jgi:uncharacterized protein